MGERRHQINPFEDASALNALRGLPAFEEALARLLHLAEHGRPCGIVRGPAGVGKTPLLEFASDELRRIGLECGFVDLRKTFADEFAWCIASELAAAPACSNRRGCWRLIEDILLGRSLAGRSTVLILDHVGEGETELLAELRRLLAIADASAGWVTVLGAARSELRTVDGFVQEHSDLRIELDLLSAEETGEFLRRVIEFTGCSPFSEEAVETIYEYSQGVLRNVMTLCRLAVLAGTMQDTPHVTAEIVRLVAAEVTPACRPPRIMADDVPRFGVVD